MSDLRQALEAALLDSPDDRATCSAYADYLAEQGDPRGELMQVQLALEDTRTGPERKKLRAREKSLLKKHERDWLGDLARWLIDGDTSDWQEGYYRNEARYAHSWRRGLLNRIEVTQFGHRFAQALANAPAARWLRELAIGHDPTYFDDGNEIDPPTPRTPTPPEAGRHQAIHELIGAPCLNNLRVFQMRSENDSTRSCISYAPGLEQVIESMPRIEELHLFTKLYDVEAVFRSTNLANLRMLQADHLRTYPLEVLAANPAVGNLTSLGFHPHFSEDSRRRGYGFLPLSSFAALLGSPHIRGLTHLRFHLSSMGDEGIRLLVESGWLKRLKVLDLWGGCVTDAGAQLLAGCPDLKNLESLDLSHNQLTPEGVRALKRTKVRLRCDDQAQPGSVEYLGEGDFE